MKISIEAINGELCTVVKRPFDAVAVRKSLAMGVPVVVERWDEKCILVDCEQRSAGDDIFYCANSSIFCGLASEFEHMLTILPALPKHPKPEDAALLYRYASEGVFLVGTYGDENYETCGFRQFLQMYHNGSLKSVCGAVDADGNRVEVAIEEK